MKNNNNNNNNNNKVMLVYMLKLKYQHNKHD